MQELLVLLGFACVIAALTGGALTVVNISIPTLDSIGRQLGVGLFGVVLMILGLTVIDSNSRTDAVDAQVQPPDPDPEPEPELEPQSDPDPEPDSELEPNPESIPERDGDSIPESDDKPNHVPDTTSKPEPMSIFVDDFSTEYWAWEAEYRPGDAQHPHTVDVDGSEVVIDWILPPPPPNVEKGKWGISIWIWYEGQCWDPAERGAIDRVSFSVDRRMISASTGSVDAMAEGIDIGVSESFAVRQGGRNFVVDDRNRAMSIAETEYGDQEPSRTATANDFDLDLGSPDFSTSGEEICFGLLRSNSTQRGAGIRTSHAFDNFEVEVTPVR